MKIGMLWFDNDPKTTLAEKIIKAMEYHANKYGRVPDLCLVNPAALDGTKPPEIGGMTIRPYRVVLPGHLWIGIADKT